MKAVALAFALNPIRQTWLRTTAYGPVSSRSVDRNKRALGAKAAALHAGSNLRVARETSARGRPIARQEAVRPTIDAAALTRSSGDPVPQHSRKPTPGVRSRRKKRLNSIRKANAICAEPMIVAPVSRLQETVSEAQRLMADASAVVLRHEQRTASARRG